jgi:putative ABC transport system substrate-binding protein
MRRREFITLLGGTVWPAAARAQQASGVPTIGVLWHAGSADEEQPFFGALHEGFKDLGYIEGQNIRLEHRFPNEVSDRFRSMVADLVAIKVDIIVSVGPGAYYARRATGTIPHVFVLVPDPVGEGFVESLARPGGNDTGLSLLSIDLTKKRVQLLHEAIPDMTSAGLLIDPRIPAARTVVNEAEVAAFELGLHLQVFQAQSIEELEGAFDAMTRAGIQGLIVGAAGLFYLGRTTIARLATVHRLPIGMYAREYMEPGAFMSYGPSMVAIIRRAPIYVDKILKGAKPSDLPVEQPTKFELLINLKTAKAMGVDVSPMMLARADEIIE